MLRAVASGGDQTVANLDVASGGSIDLYNTTPISSTDFERLRLNYLANVAQIFTQNDGSGTGRALQVGAATTDGQTGPQRYTQWNAAAAPHISHAVSLGTGTGIAHELASGSMSASSGTQTAVAVSPTFAQTSTAAGIALLVNPSGTFGSGGGLLQLWQLAGTNRAGLDTNGTFGAISLGAGVGGIYWGNGVLSGYDLSLQRDAADTLAQRRSTNAQISRGYRTYTDSSNYVRWAHQTGADYVEFAAETAGTGADDLDVRLTPAGTGGVNFPGGTLLKTRAALTDGAAAAAGTLLNAPAAGNPTKWIPINDNGTTRYIPAW